MCGAVARRSRSGVLGAVPVDSAPGGRRGGIAILKTMRSSLAFFLLAAGVFAADGPRRAPGFALPDSKMQIHDLYDYRGKPVVLEFMNTGCPHCAAFANILEKVQAKFGDRVAVISVANPPDTLSTVGAFMQGHKITYPVLFDSGQAAFSYVRSMKFDLPQVYLIDANGMIYGHYTYDALSKSIFEGDGLLYEIDRLFGQASGKK